LPELIKKNLEENPILAQSFPLGDLNLPDEDYLKAAV
jgi:hypothetical protein